MMTVIIYWDNKNRDAAGLFGHPLQCVRNLLGAEPATLGTTVLHHSPDKRFLQSGG